MKNAALFAIAVILALPAMAAEIKVINPDGSVSVLDLPAGQSPVRVNPGAAPVLKQVEPAPEPVKAAPKPVPRAKPVQEVKAAPASAPKPEYSNKDPKPAPVRAESMGRVVAKKVEAPDIAGPLDADAATRIAIAVAPPARGFAVTRRTYNERPAFMVTFKTENGPHDVLIDAETGEVLKR